MEHSTEGRLTSIETKTVACIQLLPAIFGGRRKASAFAFLNVPHDPLRLPSKRRQDAPGNEAAKKIHQYAAYDSLKKAPIILPLVTLEISSQKPPFSLAFENTPAIVFRNRGVVWVVKQKHKNLF